MADVDVEYAMDRMGPMRGATTEVHADPRKRCFFIILAVIGGTFISAMLILHWFLSSKEHHKADVLFLLSAALASVLVFPLLHVVWETGSWTFHWRTCSFTDKDIDKDIDEDRDKTVKDVYYKLTGKLINDGAFRELDKLSRGDKNHPLLDGKIQQWYEKNCDASWYKSGKGSFCYYFAKAVLNMSSAFGTLFHNKLYEISPETANFFGYTWVISIEVPYMILLLCWFIYTAWDLFFGPASRVGRDEQSEGMRRALSGCPEEDEEQINKKTHIKAIVRCAGLLKSLGRFSALNLLEAIHIEGFMRRKKKDQVMDLFCGLLGFMALRCKVIDVADIAGRRLSKWKLAEFIKVLAFVNNMLSIIDVKNKMMSAAIDTKDYRKDRWFVAVAEHVYNYHDAYSVTVRNSELNKHKMTIYTLIRLVSFGPQDAGRVIDELLIEASLPSERYVKRIPKEVADAIWNWQFTNIIDGCRLWFSKQLASHVWNRKAIVTDRTFKQGKMGIHYDDQGVVKEVMEGEQADSEGIFPGFQIVTVEKAKFSREAVEKAENSGAAYNIIFKVTDATDTFQPGKMGIVVDAHGVVVSEGYRKGFQIVKVNDEVYSEKAVEKAEQSGADYKITFKVPPAESHVQKGKVGMLQQEVQGLREEKIQGMARRWRRTSVTSMQPQAKLQAELQEAREEIGRLRSKLDEAEKKAEASNSSDVVGASSCGDLPVDPHETDAP